MHCPTLWLTNWLQKKIHTYGSSVAQPCNMPYQITPCWSKSLLGFFLYNLLGCFRNRRYARRKVVALGHPPALCLTESALFQMTFQRLSIPYFPGEKRRQKKNQAGHINICACKRIVARWENVWMMIKVCVCVCIWAVGCASFSNLTWCSLMSTQEIRSPVTSRCSITNCARNFNDLMIKKMIWRLEHDVWWMLL